MLLSVHTVRESYGFSSLPPIVMKQKVAVVGAGVLGITMALELQKKGLDVTIIAESLPTSNLELIGRVASPRAAGIFAPFNVSSSKLMEQITHSYSHWQQLADRSSSVMPVMLDVATEDTTWAQNMPGFKHLDPGWVSLPTYSFNPITLLLEIFTKFQSEGGEVVQRSLSDPELERLKGGESLEEYDHSFLAMGIDARKIISPDEITPMRGVIVHFDTTDRVGGELPRCLMISKSGEKPMYVVFRPCADGRVEIILGGTYEHAETCTAELANQMAEDVVLRVNKSISSRDLPLGLFRLADRKYVTVGYRPCTPSGSDPLSFVSEQISYLFGYGPAGWCASPEACRLLALQICEQLGV